MASVRALGGSLGPPAAALPQRGERQTGTLAGRSRRPRDRRRQRLNPPIWFLLLPTRGSRRRPGDPRSKLPSLPAPAASPPPARPQAHTPLPPFHPGRPAFAGPLTSPGEDGGLLFTRPSPPLPGAGQPAWGSSQLSGKSGPAQLWEKRAWVDVMSKMVSQSAGESCPHLLVLSRLILEKDK